MPAAYLLQPHCARITFAFCSSVPGVHVPRARRLEAPSCPLHGVRGEYPCTRGDRLSLLLELILQRKLHLARSLRRKDMVERRRTDVTVGQPKIGAVQDVKQFRAELQLR
jgi:hypothetical protein